MAGRRGPSRPRAAKQRGQAKRRRGIEDEGSPQGVRRSKRISEYQEATEDKRLDRRHPSLSTQEAYTHSLWYNSDLPSLPSESQNRTREAEPPVDGPPTDGPQNSLQSLHEGPSFGRTNGHDAVSRISSSQRSHISVWVAKKEWPKEFFEHDDVQRLLAKKPSSTASLRRQQAEAIFAISTMPSDLQVDKSAPYRRPDYETVFERDAGSYFGRYKPGVTEASKRLCYTLLHSKQNIPKDTIFDDNSFEDTCDTLRRKPAARIFKDCTPLIVPWAEAHALCSDDRVLDIAIESVNESWNNSNPITKPRPQPDYAVGFRRSAFSEMQFEKLEPFFGEPSFLSYFMGTHYMHFPFFTCEVKGGSGGLNIADRQNLHSMTLAVRAIVELFRLVDRVEELHREILAFSISHDHESVRIYGHFPVLEGTRITYWRHSIRRYDFTERKGIERWTAYKFMKNVYDIWMPNHFKMITSAINALPARRYPASSSYDSELEISETSGVSQQLEDQMNAEVRDSLSSTINI